MKGFDGETVQSPEEKIPKENIEVWEVETALNSLLKVTKNLKIFLCVIE